MALTKTVIKKVFGQDVAIKNVYIEVNEIQGNKKEANILVNFYSEDKTEIIEVKSYTYNLSLEGDNFIKQAYEHLKTLDEFKDAEDC